MRNHKTVEKSSEATKGLLYDHSHLFTGYDRMEPVNDNFAAEVVNLYGENHGEGLEGSLRRAKSILDKMNIELMKAALLVKESRRERLLSAQIRNIPTNLLYPSL